MERKWTSYDACACVEGFDGEEHEPADYLAAWQYLIDTGDCWKLQGWYGRTAKHLIDHRICRPAA